MLLVKSVSWTLRENGTPEHPIASGMLIESGINRVLDAEISERANRGAQFQWEPYILKSPRYGVSFVWLRQLRDDEDVQAVLNQLQSKWADASWII